MREIDASQLPPELQAPAKNVVTIDRVDKRRPESPADEGCTLRAAGYRVINATDQVGLFLAASYDYRNDRPPICARRIEVEDYETSDFTRTRDGHMDHLRIELSIDPTRPVDVLIRNVHLTNSPDVPGTGNKGILGLHIEGGYGGDVTIDGLTTDNVSGGNAVDLKAGGKVNRLRVTRCPGLRLTLQGRHDSFVKVESDGTAEIIAAAVDWKGETIRPVGTIERIDATEPTPAPLPAPEPPPVTPPPEPTTPPQPPFAELLKRFRTLPEPRRAALLLKVGVLSEVPAHPLHPKKESDLVKKAKKLGRLGQLWGLMQPWLRKGKP